MTSFPTRKTQQTKSKFPNPPKPPNNQNKNSSNKERQRKKASKPTKETTQLSPNHTLQAQKCSKQPYIPRNSSSFRRFLSSDSEVSRVSKAADKRERERLGLAIFDAFMQRRSLGPFSFYWPISDRPLYLSDLHCGLLYLWLCPYHCWVISTVKDRERVCSGIETTHSNLVNIRYTRPVVSYPNIYFLFLFFSHCRFRFFSLSRSIGWMVFSILKLSLCF